MVWERSSPVPTAVPWAELRLDLQDASIDIREHLKRILEEHGHVVFLRSPTKQRCACWHGDTEFDEFNPNCPDCQGFGFYYLDKRVRTYRRPAFGTFGLSGATQRTEVGELGVADLVFYFEHQETPVIGHHIVEVTTDDEGQPTVPIRIERTFQIHQAHLYREKLGRPEYWITLCKERTVGK